MSDKIKELVRVAGRPPVLLDVNGIVIASIPWQKAENGGLDFDGTLAFADNLCRARNGYDVAVQALRDIWTDKFHCEHCSENAKDILAYETLHKLGELDETN